MSAMDEAVEAAARASWEGMDDTPWFSVSSDTKFELRREARRQLRAGAPYLQAEALREVRTEIARSFPYGGELRHDGSEDPQAAAYAEGLRDAWQIVAARVDALTAEDTRHR